jgi:hypothetical protein
LIFFQGLIMNKRFQVLLWIGFAIFVTACSHNQPQRTDDFARADSNGDGRVTLPEWLGFGGAEAAFLAIDRERTGKLDEAEFREALRMSDQGAGVTQRQQQNLDARLVQQIKAALQANRNLNAWNIRVESYQNSVTLSGAVRSEQEKRLAEDIARSVNGINQVFNQIVIRQ